MTRISFALRPLASLLVALIGALVLAGGCAQSGHPTRPGQLGRIASSEEMLAVISEPGPVRFTRVVAADWVVPLSGLLNLDHPKAKAARLTDGEEAIQIYFYVLEHPRFGTYIIDSGVSRELLEPEKSERISFLVRRFMNTAALKVHVTTADWLAERGGQLDGVFLTHIHMDHIMGLADLPQGTPIYTGPGEAGASAFMNVFTRGSIDRLLAGVSPLSEWPFEDDAGGRFEGVLDVFGDGSVWALQVPGHSPGSTAFLVRSEQGPKLLVGDVSHTAWGWEHDVEPGSFTEDHELNRQSLMALRALAAAHPKLEVHLGHQSVTSPVAHLE
jgi:N-acyl homoserine lactone hydrolase